MLFALHMAVEAGVVITSYRDRAEGLMQEDDTGAGRFVEVVLRPEVVVAEPVMVDGMAAVHHRAHERCFIANSVSFPVRCDPTTSGPAS